MSSKWNVNPRRWLPKRNPNGGGSASSTPKGGGAPPASEPPWKRTRGDKRIMMEFLEMKREAEAGKGVRQVYDLELVEDNVRLWRFKLRNFDEDTAGGRQINQDLKQLARKHGQDHILMEASFPADYPQQPFFLRVIKPRCMWYTGHVTAGGSICIEALTLCNSPNSWRPDFCVEAILNVVVSNMVDCERVQVRTMTGPGGLSGPLRVDLSHRYCSNVMTPYSEREAKSAFQRQMANHNRSGWG